MRLSSTFSVFALTTVAFASVLHLDLYTESSDGKRITTHDQEVLAPMADDPPRWRKRDEGHLVPLIPGAKTGALPIEVEEGLTHALGPRFANVFIEAALAENNGTSMTAGSCPVIKCAGTMIKAAPCITAAIKCKCVDPILKCPGVSISDLCKCVGCLPEFAQKLIQQLGVCSKAAQDWQISPTIDSDQSEYPEYVSFSTRDANLLAYRGDISKSTLSEAREVAATGFCPGQPCGDCPCCLGLCVFNQCVGACISPPTQSNDHREL